MGDGNALMSESTMRKGGQGEVTQRRDEEYGGYGATLLGCWAAGLPDCWRHPIAADMPSRWHAFTTRREANWYDGKNDAPAESAKENPLMETSACLIRDFP